MSDSFSLIGSYQTVPTVGSPSLIAQVLAPINQQMQWQEKQLLSGLDLSSDSAYVVPFGPVTGAHVVIIQSPNGKVKATFTSADGTSQSIPVDPTGILISKSVPITALSLTRVAGQDTPGIDVLLGQSF